MSDENLNNNSEETAALFVSAQKKKKAEEEARRKAEEEQAKRDAAEAEVRRMEQEVEDRKRKAEEEKRALEEASKKPAASGGKSRTPIFIGIGAAVVVILIAVFALGKGGGSKKSDAGSVAEAQFTGEYVSKEAGYDIKISYPDSVYTAVSEKKTADDDVLISFSEEGKEDEYNGVDIALIDWLFDGQPLGKEDVGIAPAKDRQQELSENTQEYIYTFMNGVEFISEESAEIDMDSPDKYHYTCTYKSEAFGYGAAMAWIEPNSENKYKEVIVMVTDNSETLDNALAILDAFTAHNANDALMMPGGYPPETTALNDVLKIEDIHMGMPVPSDRFFESSHKTNYHVYSDINGAVIIVNPRVTDISISEAYDNPEVVEEYCKEQAKTGLNQYFSNVESRMLVDERTFNPESDHKVGYVANY
ncbi:MAG: hypothetical protein K5770_04890, partial [Lachnospiraceae bacterium]|nr:hypothetical protein [Lachnospiraceae bacterium]